MAAQPTSAAETQQSSRAEPHQQTRQEQLTQYGQCLDQMLHALQQCGGQPSAGSEIEKM
jgi:hypothetical protein